MNTQDLEILSVFCSDRSGKPVTPPPYAIKLLEDTCSRTGLDWKMRHVYLMSRGGRWQVTLSIDGFRLIGTRDPEYAGQEGPFWVESHDSEWTDIPPQKAPYASKVGIKRKNGDITWGVAKFDDYKSGPMWDKFATTMTAKCAEMLGWRKAFPGKFGGLYGLEEMDQAGGPKTMQANPLDKEYDKELASEELVIAAYKREIMGQIEAGKLKELGVKIKADKSLSAVQMIDLHQFYTRKLKQLQEDNVANSKITHALSEKD